MVKVKRALVSVSDKTGLVDFAAGLQELGVEILSTGGTAKLLREHKISVKDVSEYTGFPEMLDGRVKTLHPRVHAGLLAVRENPDHMRQIKNHNIGLIDMVVVNLYPFESVIQKQGVSFDEAIENIDIGGPSMLRSAAKNYRSVAVVTSPGRYASILDELKKKDGSLSAETLESLGHEVFRLTSYYDGIIYSYLKRQKEKGAAPGEFPSTFRAEYEKIQELRYGENPHQKAAFYRDLRRTEGLAFGTQLHGKELSFNNILDLASAYDLVREFEKPAAVILKHNNPCGAAEAATLKKAYLDAWKCDTLSAFGGIVGLNRRVDVATAQAISRSGFLECVIAPSFDELALTLLKQKKNLRIFVCDFKAEKQDTLDFRSVSGGALVQDKDVATLDAKNLKVMTKKKPTAAQLASLIFAWKVAKHVKSNAIILVKGTRTIGIGAGQMSRVDSVFLAVKKAGGTAKTKGATLASDAFFPKDDAVKLAIKHGVRAIIQPGGSIADEEIIKVADKHSVAMVATGMRHFRH